MTSRTISIEATKRKLLRRLAVELGEDIPVDDEQKKSEERKPYILVTFDQRRPSRILPILGVVMEYAKGIATVEHNLGRRR